MSKTDTLEHQWKVKAWGHIFHVSYSSVAAENCHARMDMPQDNLLMLTKVTLADLLSSITWVSNCPAFSMPT